LLALEEGSICALRGFGGASDEASSAHGRSRVRVLNIFRSNRFEQSIGPSVADLRRRNAPLSGFLSEIGGFTSAVPQRLLMCIHASRRGG
jgi:hypothetical protein